MVREQEIAPSVQSYTEDDGHCVFRRQKLRMSHRLRNQKRIDEEFHWLVQQLADQKKCLTRHRPIENSKNQATTRQKEGSKQYTIGVVLKVISLYEMATRTC